MAHQARHGLNISLGPRCLLQRPEMAALLGVVASEWAAYESSLTFLYGALMGYAIPYDRRRSPFVHPIGYQVFDTLVSHEPRLKLINKLVNEFVQDSEILAHCNTSLLPQLRKASKSRNNLIHATWAIDETYPDSLLKVTEPYKVDVYDKSDFNETIDIIVEASTAIREFDVRVGNHLESVNLLASLDFPKNINDVDG